MFRIHTSVAFSKTTVRLRLSLAVIALLTGALVCVYPSAWHHQPTFYYINNLLVPWWVYGCCFALAGVCIAFSKSRPIGYLIGLVVYTFFSVGTWLAVIGGLHLPWLNIGFPPHQVGNPFAATNLSALAFVYLVVLREAIYKQVDPELEQFIDGSTTG